MGKREVEIVATEENMVAHGDALESRHRRIRPWLHGKKTEIGRPSANVHHQHMGFPTPSAKRFQG